MTLNRSRSSKSISDGAPAFTRAGEGVSEALHEEGAVGQTRQAVVESLVGETFLGVPALGDIPVVGDDPAYVGIVEQVFEDRLHVPPRTVRVPHAKLDGRPGFASG